MFRRSVSLLLIPFILIGCGQTAASPVADGKAPAPETATPASNSDSNIKWGKNATLGATLDEFNAKLGPLMTEADTLVTTVVDASKKNPKKDLAPALDEVLPKLKKTCEEINAIPAPTGTVMIGQEVKSMYEELHDKLDLYKTAIGNGVFDDVPRLEAEVTETAKTHMSALKSLLDENGFNADSFMSDGHKLVKK